MLRVTDANGLRTLTLDRPQQLNALTGEMIDDLLRVLADSAKNPSVRALVLTGAGRGFCSGVDLSGMAKASDAQPNAVPSPEQIVANMSAHAQIPILLHRMGKPTIASIRGPAAGTGLIYAMACDIRIASDTAVLRMAFASAGRCGDPGGSYFLTKLVGAGRAREIYLLDPKMSAQEALAAGLVTKVVPDDQLEIETHALAQRLAEGPTMAYAGIKRNLNAAETLALEETIAAEAPTNAAASLSHDGKEAARAFMEKRKPIFRGY